MTDRHVLNAIRYWERQLSVYPGEQYYIGDSEFAEACVEADNKYNEDLKNETSRLINRLKREAKKRKIL